MFKLIFKIISCIGGTILALVAIARSSDPTDSILLLFYGALLLIVGSLTKGG